jgi:hypothetical protein
MSELSIRELKEKLEKIEARNEKLNQEAESVREVIEKKDDAFKPLREQHLEVGVTKILEELGWTKTEYINALGGEIKEIAKVETKGSSKTYVMLIPLNEGANCAPANLIKMTPRLSKDAKAIIAEVGLIRLLKNTINLTTDEVNKRKAEAKLKEEEAKANETSKRMMQNNNL